MKCVGDLENGHVVKFSNGAFGLVFKGFMTYTYIMDGKKIIAHFATDKAFGKSEDSKTLESVGIVEVRSIQSFCNETFLVDANRAFVSGALVYRKEIVKEMTVAEIEAKLGYSIKVVK